MTEPEQPLVAAFDAVHDQIDAALAEKHRLVGALAETEQRLNRLRRSADQMVECLGLPERLDRRMRLDRGRRMEARAYMEAKIPTRPAAILMRYLARYPYANVRNSEIRRHIRGFGIPVTARHVANLMHRKTQQGVLRRCYRGVYEINRAHPLLQFD